MTLSKDALHPDVVSLPWLLELAPPNATWCSSRSLLVALRALSVERRSRISSSGLVARFRNRRHELSLGVSTTFLIGLMLQFRCGSLLFGKLRPNTLRGNEVFGGGYLIFSTNMLDRHNKHVL